MEKVLYLCFSCAATMAEGYELRELQGQLKNARCERCARRAWGSTYEITPKKAKNNRGTTTTGCAATGQANQTDLHNYSNTYPFKKSRSTYE